MKPDRWGVAQAASFAGAAVLIAWVVSKILQPPRYAFQTPIEPRSVWPAVIVVMLFLAGGIAFSLFAKPTVAVGEQRIYHTGDVFGAHVAACVLGTFFMFLAGSSIIDGAHRQNGGVGIIIGLMCAPLALFILYFRRSVLVDGAQKTLRVNIGRPRAIFGSTYPASAIQALHLVHVVNQYGASRGWNVTADLGSKQVPIVVRTHQADAEQQLAWIRSALGVTR